MLPTSRLADNFGSGSGGGSVALGAVPEPTSILLLIAGTAAIAVSRRRQA